MTINLILIEWKYQYRSKKIVPKREEMYIDAVI